MCLSATRSASGTGELTGRVAVIAPEQGWSTALGFHGVNRAGGYPARRLFCDAPMPPLDALIAQSRALRAKAAAMRSAAREIRVLAAEMRWVAAGQRDAAAHLRQRAAGLRVRRYRNDPSPS